MLKKMWKYIYALLFFASFPLLSNSLERPVWELEEAISTSPSSFSLAKTLPVYVVSSQEDKLLFDSIQEKEANSRFLFSEFSLAEFFTRHKEEKSPVPTEKMQTGKKFLLFSNASFLFLDFSENNWANFSFSRISKRINNEHKQESGWSILSYLQLFHSSPPKIKLGAFPC